MKSVKILKINRLELRNETLKSRTSKYNLKTIWHPPQFVLLLFSKQNILFNTRTPDGTFLCHQSFVDKCLFNSFNLYIIILYHKLEVKASNFMTKLF